MGLFKSMQISATGLTAERLRLDVIAANVANAETTRTPEGGPYRRKMVVFRERLERALDGAQRGTGVEVAAVLGDATPPRQVYEPAHPDADARGVVSYPNVDLVMEMSDMISATRAYEANVTVLNAAKAMALKTLEIGRG